MIKPYTQSNMTVKKTNFQLQAVKDKTRIQKQFSNTDQYVACISKAINARTWES